MPGDSRCGRLRGGCGRSSPSQRGERHQRRRGRGRRILRPPTRPLIWSLSGHLPPHSIASSLPSIPISLPQFVVALAPLPLNRAAVV